jgi:hypothetical protein
MKAEHERSVQEVLETALKKYQAAHEAYWSKELPKREYLGDAAPEPPRDEWYGHTMALGREALRLADRLGADSFAHSYVLGQALEPDGPYYRLPITALEIQAARRFAYGLPDMVDRVTEIVAFAAEFPMPDRVRGHATMLAQCYVLGLETVCLILCRAVLESALKDRLNAQDRKLMWQLLRDAEKQGVLSKDLKAEATEVKRRGDRAVHRQQQAKIPALPSNEVPAFETIRMTLFLLACIYGEETSDSPPSLL